MSTWNPNAYPLIPAAWFGGDEPNDLGPGTCNRPVCEEILAADVRSWFPGGRPADLDMARACQAALLLRHDNLEEAHRIAQGIPSTTGSYWHGIMHRREGDFSNAAYWFRRVGNHDVFGPLLAAAQAIPAGEDVAWVREVRRWDNWDPFTFIDWCSMAVGKGGAAERWCREVALAEWRLLFDYAYRHAQSG